MNSMSPDHSLLADWQPRHAQLFGHHTIKLHHRLAETGLFTREALGRLIERCPPDHYGILSMGHDKTKSEKIHGEFGDCSGLEVIEAIERGRMWLNLRRIMDFDLEYRALLDRIFSEFEARVPRLKTYKRNIGVLISSPNAQVYYHADIQGQSLWQIEGSKRVYLYPASEVFLPPTSLEKILLRETDEDVLYKPWFEEFAHVHELRSGEMLTWPLYAPHRVENNDCLNISVTMEHWTKEIWNAYAVIRRTLKLDNPSTRTTGLSVYPKAASAFAWKKLGREIKGDVVKAKGFRVDPKSPDGVEFYR
jgi:hypothetical protein